MQFNWIVYRWTAKCSALSGLILCSLWSFHRLIMCHVTGCSTHDAKLHFLQKQDVGLNSLRVLNTQCTKKQIFLLFNVYDMIRSVLKCRFGPIVLELCRIKMRTIWCGTIHVETAEEYEHSAQAHVTLFFSDKFKFNSNIVTTICNTQVLLLCGRCSSGLHCSFLKPTTYYAPAFCRLSRRCMRNWNAGVCSDSHTCLCLTVKVQNVQALAAILYCRHMLLYLMLILKILNLLAYCQPECRHSYS